MPKPQVSVCSCCLCRPSLKASTIELHIACGCSDDHCAARRISDESFLRTFTDDVDLKGAAFSFVTTLVGGHIGLALMGVIAQNIATINSDGYVRALGLLGSQADH